MKMVLGTLMLFMSIYSYAQNNRQSDYYLREAQRYERLAQSYEGNEEYYSRQAKTCINDADYYLRHKNYSMMNTKLESAKNAGCHATDNSRKAKAARQQAEQYRHKANNERKR